MNSKVLFFLLLMVAPVVGMAQAPMVKVDFNMENRTELEVNESGYTPWFMARVHTDSKTVNGVTFTLTAIGPNANSAFRANWNKANVQNPIYMRLVGDGIRIDNDTMLKYSGKSAIIELKVKGLPIGKHTLQTYHNTYENTATYSLAPMNIYLNDVLQYSNIKRSILVTKKADATVVLTTMIVTQAGQDMVLKFEADPTFVPESGKTADRNVIINGFELNTDDASKQANTPTPSDKDFHKTNNAGVDTLRWNAAMNGFAKSHNLYFGTDSAIVANATTSSTSVFKGTLPLNTKSYRVENLYNLNTYYWRVDETDSSDVVTKGAVWSFRPQHLSFPGAEGYGRDAIGGRGGKVVYVTNLNDNGPGSFREAVTSNIGPRTVLFAVSGLITLESRLVVSQPYITIAGQSAPGKGVCFRWAPVGITGNDIIVQNLRLRLGIGVTYDGMGLTGANHSIVDHCSISWTIDEAFSSRSGKNITLQNTLISEALNVAGHQNYPDGTAHGYAGSIGGDVGSFHHNLLAHCSGRNWSLAGGLDGNGYYAGKLDIFNTVVYNYGSRATDGGVNQGNFVNNYYKKGPATSIDYILNAQLEGTGKGSQSYYYSGNIKANQNGTYDCNGTDNSCGNKYSLSGGQVLDWTVFVNKPFFPSYATITSASDAFKSVLSDVGCTQPVLDDHDKRVIDETLKGTTTYKGSRSGKLGLPDNENDVGSWESYPGYSRANNWDSDLDGLPDWWETAHGLSIASPAGSFLDSNGDLDNDGYTNLEEYLHWMANPHLFVTQGSVTNIDMSQYTKGYTKSPVISLSNITNGQATVVANSATVKFTATNSGLANFTLIVTDADGATKSKQVGIFVGSTPADAPFNYTYFKDRAQSQTVSVVTTSVPKVENNTISNILFYPNPVKEVLNIKFDSKLSSESDFIIYDFSGAVVFQDKRQVECNVNHFTFNTSSLKTGIYSLRIKNASVDKAIKFMVQ